MDHGDRFSLTHRREGLVARVFDQFRVRPVRCSQQSPALQVRLQAQLIIGSGEPVKEVLLPAGRHCGKSYYRDVHWNLQDGGAAKSVAPSKIHRCDGMNDALHATQ